MSLNKILGDKVTCSDIQKKLNKRYQCALVCLSLNIPGRKKNNPIAKNLFEEGKAILERLPFKPIAMEEFGLHLFYCYNDDARTLKERLTQIEETHELGRFFDFDVYDKNLEKISRQTPRQCFVCSHDAFSCARSKAHSTARLERHIQKKIKNYFCQKFSKNAYEALVSEVDCTPKPGLVDKNNNGSHKDMSHALFLKSAKSLRPFFYECVERGFTFKGKNPQTFFKTLRNLGKTAEKTMLQETKGVNTHKGAIFSLGLSSAALGFLLSQGKKTSAQELSLTIQMMCQKTLKKELRESIGQTSGEKIFKELKIAGIREEASMGHSFTIFNALPYFTEEKKQNPENEAAVKTFLYLLTKTKDTNLIKRGGLDALKKAQETAKKILSKSPFSIAEVEKMDQDFINNNLSPGGTADLLALIFFLEQSLNTNKLYKNHFYH